MLRKSARHPIVVSVTSPLFKVQLCRGCCCGTTAKHPTIDHKHQLTVLTEAANTGGGSVRVVDCLGECHASNMLVVLTPNRTADWIGWIVDDDILSDVADWLAAGAPEVPAHIQPHLIERERN